MELRLNLNSIAAIIAYRTVDTLPIMSPLYSGAKIICRCLEISENDLLEAVERGDLRSLTDVIRTTGAGDGCTACRARILEYLKEHRELAAVS